MFKKQEKTIEEPTPEKGKLRDYFESLVVAIILALIVKTFVLQTFQIPTGSMEDGLLVGDHLIVNKMIFGDTLPLLGDIFGTRDVKRGDVVVFKYPPDPNVDYIKRVIGMPGETIRIHQHQVWVNDVRLEELSDGSALDEDSYTLRWRNNDEERARAIGYYADGREPLYEPWGDISAKTAMTFRVPEDQYFMMGDHRRVSQDSRAWGFVPREHIKGRAVIIYWSSDADRAQYRETNFFKQVTNTVVGVVSFPFRTRWSRLLNLVS